MKPSQAGHLQPSLKTAESGMKPEIYRCGPDQTQLTRFNGQHGRGRRSKTVEVLLSRIVCWLQGLCVLSSAVQSSTAVYKREATPSWLFDDSAADQPTHFGFAYEGVALALRQDTRGCCFFE